MCREEGVNLQRGMNFGSSGRPSVVLMSRRPAHLTTTGLKMMVVSLSTKATTGHKSGAARTQRRSTNLSAGQGARLPRTDYFSKLPHNTANWGRRRSVSGCTKRCVLASGRSMAHSGLSMAGGKSRTDVGIQVPARGRSRCDAGHRLAGAASRAEPADPNGCEAGRVEARPRQVCRVRKQRQSAL